MAPAQQFPLFHIEMQDMYTHGADGHVNGMSKDRFIIHAEYIGPTRFADKIRRRKYSMRFEFGVDLFDGALIPPLE
jgi:hypothetical protein